MQVIILTGGVATGKSTCAQLLEQMLPTPHRFDCDASVHRLLAEDAIVRQKVIEAFGDEMLDAGGTLSRKQLRERVFQDELARNTLEAILHPRVREECLAFLQLAAKKSAEFCIVEIPLFFEKKFTIGPACVLVVACSPATQMQRLAARNGLDPATAQAMVSSQLSIFEKISLADLVFWNEGPPSLLESQARRFAQELMMNDPENSASAAIAPADPAVIHLQAFREKPLAELQAMAETVPARISAGISKSQLIYELCCFYGSEGTQLEAEGIIEIGKDNFAMLRDPARSFRPGQDDIHLGSHFLRDHGLRVGQLLKVRIKPPRERGKYLSVSEIIEIEGIPLTDYQAPTDFDRLTPLFPDQRIHLEGEGPDFLGVRVIDLIAPLGKGQRGIIVAPPRGGKTILLKQIARSIIRNHPEAVLIILLLDERPEEVTDFEETVGSQVFASTFDEAPKRHAQVAELVIERAKRLVEQGKDVILLLDSLTRLARGYNSAMQGGPIGSGGVSPAALQKSRKFFSSARNVEEGGSLTILATALVETESRLDDVVFEEFKGTGNMEVRLDRELAERRVYPAIHIPQSGTRNDDRLYHPDEFLRVVDVRKQLAQQPIGDAIETLLTNLRATKSNAEFLLRGLR